MNTGFVYDPQFLEHEPGIGHPERKERLSSAIAYLQQQPWFTQLVTVAARSAERRWIQNIHADDYIDRAYATCHSGASFLDVSDVGVCKRSFDVALLAAGSLMDVADKVVGGQLDNGFVMARPPGHHAEHDTALGFCMFNNVAVTARYLQQHHGLDKVLILDWDVHHGNGTQHSFEDDPSVLYVSTHQYPFYPGTGAYSETGIGAGTGATLNCPLPAGAEDTHYETAWREHILPKIDAFAPQMILVSAGFDAHRADPLAQMSLSTEFYGWMTERLMEQAEKHCAGRLVSILEGGYNIDELPQCIGEHLQVLAGRTATAAAN
ncbi:MAG: acetoin utilization deacetylase AcuC-like enzyme [Gammaproteobacteria bacterium]|jgi:acetoin utilization deacetylase AcuC-like enzyme